MDHIDFSNRFLIQSMTVTLVSGGMGNAVLVVVKIINFASLPIRVSYKLMTPKILVILNLVQLFNTETNVQDFFFRLHFRFFATF